MTPRSLLSSASWAGCEGGGERSTLYLDLLFQIKVTMTATAVAEKWSALAISVELAPEGGSEPRLSEHRRLFAGASSGAPDCRSDCGT